MDLFRKKETERLKEELESKTFQLNLVTNQLESAKRDTGWLIGHEYSSALPGIKVSDGDLKEAFRQQFSLSKADSSRKIDWIEKYLADNIAMGRGHVVWQNLGTFYAVFRNGKWFPRLKWHRKPRKVVAGDGEKPRMKE